MVTLNSIEIGVKITVWHDVNNQVIVTDHENYLIDIVFEVLPELSQLNPALKMITGIAETSLFYNMAAKAVIAGASGVRILEKNTSNDLSPAHQHKQAQ